MSTIDVILPDTGQKPKKESTAKSHKQNNDETEVPVTATCSSESSEPPSVPVPNTMLRSSSEFGDSLYILPDNGHIRELRTVIWNKSTSRSDFKFHADRLIRLVVEEGLNLLPYSPASVTTPTGSRYDGLRYERANCGVSIVRSGEAMEQGLRECCRSMRIGKVLVASDCDTHVAREVYAKFPADAHRRRVLLLYPIMSTGNTVARAVTVMRQHAIADSRVILLTLFCTPSAVRLVTNQFPRLRILTAEVHSVTPNHFGQRYFGTD